MVPAPYGAHPRRRLCWKRDHPCSHQETYMFTDRGQPFAWRRVEVSLHGMGSLLCVCGVRLLTVHNSSYPSRLFFRPGTTPLS